MPRNQRVIVANRICTNQSILELARLDNTARPMEEVIIDLAQKRLAEANEMLNGLDGWSPPPFTPKMVAGVLGIKYEETDDLILEDAMLCMEDGIPTIKIRRGRSDGRTNFSVFHEVIHTLFPGYHNTIQHRKQKKRNLFDPDDQLEYLCDIGAAEMLMPMDYFLKDLKARGFGALRVQYFCERYGASIEAICCRMVRSDSTTCAVALFEHQLSLKEERARQEEQRQISFLTGVDYERKKKLRITYSIPSTQFRGTGIYLPPYKSANEESCIYQAAFSGQMTCSEEDFEFGHGKAHRFYIEAFPVPSRQNESVYSPVFAFFYPR